MNEAVSKLVKYGLDCGLITEDDKIYATNLILEVLKLDDFEQVNVEGEVDLEAVLKEMLDYAAQNGILEENTVVHRDLLDTKIMNCLMPRPSEVRKTFHALYEKSPQDATNYYYKLSQDSDYIRRYRVKKDMKWIASTEYGDLDVTINLSKPEKDPKAIAAALKAKQSAYPKCQLCKENEGYAGRLNHPARENHRIIPIVMNEENFYFQYSPYVYYNEHCIVFNEAHTPMKIDKAAFRKLFDFVTLFPHYFLGSNADLPIVGGSILTHDHFQGGHYTFAMAKAPIETSVTIPGFENVEAGIVKWPMSVIRIRHKDTAVLVEAADKILKAWREYTDEDAMIFAYTDETPHNTITPIARKVGDTFEMDLVLRNNITTKECPDGLYHPHKEHHHIKKENIGLIEVMGLAVLPARLKGELADLKEAMLAGKDLRQDEVLEKHADWVDEFSKKYDKIDEQNIDKIVQDEVGLVYASILEQAGVYKRDEQGKEAFLRFIASI